LLSDLSKGTTNARGYNQAARNVACMAEAVARSGRRIEAFDQLGFYVIAPTPSRRRPTQRLTTATIAFRRGG
jgi:hypothetical protein